MLYRNEMNFIFHCDIKAIRLIYGFHYFAGSWIGALEQ